jgi:MHS family proline/betaine transporter-like MFS transporter
MKTEEPSFQMNKHSLIAGFSGNIMEWYDFTVYGFFATVIGEQFFPKEDKIVQLISAFGIFAAGYLMRPIGGIIFGHIGDKQGRKKALLISILMMAIPTTLIGFLPTYSSVGWYSALLLVILRLLQGLSVGGEFTGSISFLTEKAPSGKRGFYGSWTTFGVFGGMLIGAAIAAIVTSVFNTAQVNNFGWRIPFLFGAVIGVAGLYLRKDMSDDQRFQEIMKKEQTYKMPLAEFFAHYKMQALKIILISWAFGVSVYLLFIFLPSYLHTFLHVKLSDALSVHTIAIIFMMLIIPFFGHLSDRWGRKLTLFISLGGFILFSYPLFLLLFKKGYWAILAAMLAFSILEGIFQGVIPALMTEAFPAKVRYTGLSVSYNIALALFGGTTPMISVWLIKITNGNVLMPVYYLIATAIIAIVTLLFMPETYKKELD